MPKEKTNGSGKHYHGLILYNKNRRIPDVDVFVENSTYNRTKLKARILNQKIIPYVCDDCGCSGTWNEKPLVLVLDHINGINNDNRIKNLRFLCPNCNSQTTTFSGRNKGISRKRKAKNG